MNVMTMMHHHVGQAERTPTNDCQPVTIQCNRIRAD